MNSESGIMNLVDETYEQSVSLLAESNDSVIFRNKGEGHAEIVLKNIFKNSECEINILAKSLTSKLTSSDSYKRELYNFVDKRYGKLKVLLEDIPDNICQSSALAMIFALQRMHPENVEIAKTDLPIKSGDNKVVHFTISDSCMFRLETDIVNRSAFCCFNNTVISDSLNEAFLSAWEQSTIISSLNMLEC